MRTQIISQILQQFTPLFQTHEISLSEQHLQRMPHLGICHRVPGICVHHLEKHLIQL